MQRFGCMAGGVELVDHGAKPDNRRQIQALALIETPDLHFLAGEVIAGQIDLQPGIGGIIGVGIAADQFAQ